MDELSASLILLTVDDTTLYHRMQATLQKRNRRHGASFEVPADILDFESNRRKRDLYLEWYEQSMMERKVLVDTSALSDQELGGMLKLQPLV